MPKYIIVFGKTGQMVNGVLRMQRPGAVIELSEQEAASRGSAVRLATTAEIAADEKTRAAAEPIPNQFASTSGFPEDAAIRHDLGQDGPHRGPAPVQPAAVQRGPAPLTPAAVPAVGVAPATALPGAVGETGRQPSASNAPDTPSTERRPADAPAEQKAVGAPRGRKAAGTKRSGGTARSGGRGSR